MQPKKQLKVQYIGIFEEIDSFYIIKCVSLFTFYQFQAIKCSIKCALFSLFYRSNTKNWRFSVQILFSKNFACVKK